MKIGKNGILNFLMEIFVILKPGFLKSCAGRPETLKGK
jgi:hypothetical protein